MRACHCDNSGMSGDEVVSSVVALSKLHQVSTFQSHEGSKLSNSSLFFYVLVTIPNFTGCIRRAVSQQLKGPAFLDLVEHVFKVPH